MLDTTLVRVEVCLLVSGLTALWGLWLVRFLARRIPRLNLGPALAVAYSVRVLAIGVAAAFPAIGAKVRTTDDAAFLATSQHLAALPLGNHAWLDLARGWSEVLPWSLTIKLLGPVGDIPLRLEQIAIELTAVALVAWAAAVLGGARAGVIAAWIAALEPTNAFYATLLHRDALFLLGVAIVLVALAHMWQVRLTARNSAAALTGLLLVTSTRTYMGVFVVAAMALVVLCALLRRRVSSPRALAATGLAALALLGAGAVAAPRIAPGPLATLQSQLDARYPGYDNLSFPPTHVTTTAGLLATVFNRGADLLLRPFPWQLGNVTQRVGAGATLLWYALLVGLVVLALSGSRRRLVDVLPALALVATLGVGFSLTLVNAGTGFRHRMHLIVLLTVVAGYLVDRRLAAGGGLDDMAGEPTHGLPVAEAGETSARGRR